MTVTKPERPGDADQAIEATIAAVDEVEGEIRAFVRRDVSVFRRPRPETTDVSMDGVNSALQRVAGASVVEIERVIGELSNVRDLLRGEGERIHRELAGYASLSQATMTSMKIIADSLMQLKASAAREQRPRD
ncbi:MAG: hypothetical protein FJX62_18465 [Alphaproteobacteria bacterium]|nr:hypothetical protein [Alphaproteobacteria bacterium]